jgi:hypothetical protein
MLLVFILLFPLCPLHSLSGFAIWSVGRCVSIIGACGGRLEHLNLAAPSQATGHLAASAPSAYAKQCQYHTGCTKEELSPFKPQNVQFPIIFCTSSVYNHSNSLYTVFAAGSSAFVGTPFSAGTSTFIVASYTVPLSCAGTASTAITSHTVSSIPSGAVAFTAIPWTSTRCAARCAATACVGSSFTGNDGRFAIGWHANRSCREKALREMFS